MTPGIVADPGAQPCQRIEERRLAGVRAAEQAEDAPAFGRRGRRRIEGRCAHRFGRPLGLGLDPDAGALAASQAELVAVQLEDGRIPERCPAQHPDLDAFSEAEVVEAAGDRVGSALDIEDARDATASDAIEGAG